MNSQGPGWTNRVASVDSGTGGTGTFSCIQNRRRIEVPVPRTGIRLNRVRPGLFVHQLPVSYFIAFQTALFISFIIFNYYSLTVEKRLPRPRKEIQRHVTITPTLTQNPRAPYRWHLPILQQ